jgi:hypothetical protein
MEGMSVHPRMLRGALVAAVLASFALALRSAPAAAQEPTWTPTITWNTYLGGGTLADGGVDTGYTTDEVQGLALNALGQVLVTGGTDSRTFPGSVGLPSATSDQDVFVARYSEADTGALQGTRVFGGEEDDIGRRVVVNSEGVAFIVGTTRSPTINTAPGTPANVVAPFNGKTYQGGSDAFLARMDPDGRLAWFMYLGSAFNDEGYDLALGPEGSNVVYVVGATSGRRPATPFPPGTAESNVRYRDGEDDVSEGFITKVDVSLPTLPIVQWTRIIGSSEIDRAYAVAAFGNAVYVGGWMGDLVAGGLNALSVWPSGDYNGFVARLNDKGEFTWFTYVGGSGDDDDVRAIHVRPSGDLVLVGNTDSSNFLSPGQGGDDVYVLPMSPIGVEGKGLRIGGTGNERTEGQSAMDSVGNVYVGGRTYSLTGAGLARRGFDSELASTTGNTSDGFIAMVNPGVTEKVWASYVGGLSTGGESEWVRAIAAGPRGQLTLGGVSNAPNVLKQLVGADTTANGGLDGFLFRLEVDLLAPTPGTVTARLVPGSGLDISWKDFTDPETGIIGYEWAIGHAELGEDVRPFQAERGDVTRVTLSTFQPDPQLRYFVTVRAMNGVGRTTTTWTNVLLPAETDGGTGTDGGTDGGTDAGTPDAGTGGGTDAGTTDGGTEEDGDKPPLGWSCATGGGSGALALTGVMVMLALLAMRRERSAMARERSRDPRR